MALTAESGFLALALPEVGEVVPWFCGVLSCGAVDHVYLRSDFHQVAKELVEICLMALLK